MAKIKTLAQRRKIGGHTLMCAILVLVHALYVVNASDYAEAKKRLKIKEEYEKIKKMGIDQRMESSISITDPNYIRGWEQVKRDKELERNEVQFVLDIKREEIRKLNSNEDAKIKKKLKSEIKKLEKQVKQMNVEIEADDDKIKHFRGNAGRTRTRQTQTRQTQTKQVPKSKSTGWRLNEGDQVRAKKSSRTKGLFWFNYKEGDVGEVLEEKRDPLRIRYVRSANTWYRIKWGNGNITDANPHNLELVYRRSEESTRRASKGSSTRKRKASADKAAARRASKGSSTRRTSKGSSTRRASKGSSTRRTSKGSSTRRTSKGSSTRKRKASADKAAARRGSETHKCNKILERVFQLTREHGTSRQVEQLRGYYMRDSEGKLIPRQG